MKKENKEITIIGIVREIEDSWKFCRFDIATENGSYLIRMNEEGKNLQYEVGNKVAATGLITRTANGRRGIDVTSYEVFEMDDDYLEEFGANLEHYLKDGC